GIMVFEEVALWGKDEMVDPQHPLPKEWLTRMIKEKYNHPSVIGWCVGNEIGYFGMNPLVMEYVEGAIKMAKEIDPNRLAVYVSNSAHAQKRDATQYSDLVMLNRYSNWDLDVEKAHRYNPDKPLFLAEFGHKITDEDLNKGLIQVDSMLAGLNEKDYVVGASYWTFNDYRSAYSGTPPSGNRSWGLVNAFRQKKVAFNEFRKRYSPVRTFRLVSEKQIEIEPRSIKEFPAYKLEGYIVAWEAFNSTGEFLDGGFQTLDPILPGGEKFTVIPSWVIDPTISMKVKVSLINPLGYVVDEYEKFMKPPQSPTIIGTYVNGRSARVVFDKVFSATHYKAIYTDGGGLKETEPTINNFIDVAGLTSGKNYRLGLVAINGSGESEPYWVDSVRTQPSELPPIVWYVEPTVDGWFVGYATTEKDYAYQVRYRNVDG